MTNQPAPRRDPVVDRVNEMVTTLLDLLGVLLLAGAAAWAVWRSWGVGWALAVGGLVVTLLSAWAQARQRAPKPVRTARPRIINPGPEDPGTLHVGGV
jgi:hypothetical protein